MVGAAGDCLAAGVRPPGFASSLLYFRPTHAALLVKRSVRTLSGRDPSGETLTDHARNVFNRAHHRLTRKRFGIKGPHVTAAELRQILGAEVFDNYHKVAFERNPWDRMVSFYRWRTRYFHDPPSFSDFLRIIAGGEQHALKAVNAKDAFNWPVYTMDDRLAVDHLARFESLGAEVQHMCQQVDLPFDGWMPHAKGKARGSGGYRDWYSPEDRKLVGEMFRREIELLAYEF